MNVGSASSEQRISLAVEFLKVAEQDFSAAELLLDRGLYPQGLFLLQQSLEKVAKAILLALGAEPSELRREVGHDVILGSLRYLPSLIAKRYSEFENSTSGLVQMLKERGDRCAAVAEEWNKFVSGGWQVRTTEDIEILNAATLIAQLRGVSVKVKGIYDAVEVIGNQLRNLVNTLYADDRYAKMFFIFVLRYITLLMFPPSLLKQFHAFVPLLQYVNSLLNNIVSCIGGESGELIRAQVPLLKAIASAIYLQRVFFLLVVAHIPFEGQASRLRYPDYRWSPLSIGNNSAVVKIAREIVDVVKDLDLFKGLAACIQQSEECPVFKLAFSPTP